MKILIDMDGVLADFTGQCEVLFKTSLNPWPEPGNYAVDVLLKLTPEEFWRRIDETKDAFWAGMRKTKEADALLTCCTELVGRKNIAILTSPSQSPWCHYGKAAWIKNHFPELQRNLLIGACKEFCANENTVLIDDYDGNVKKFRDSGGSAVLFPRPWNTLHEKCKYPLTHVNDELRRIFHYGPPI